MSVLAVRAILSVALIAAACDSTAGGTDEVGFTWAGSGGRPGIDGGIGAVGSPESRGAAGGSERVGLGVAVGSGGTVGSGETVGSGTVGSAGRVGSGAATASHGSGGAGGAAAGMGMGIGIGIGTCGSGTTGADPNSADPGTSGVGSPAATASMNAQRQALIQFLWGGAGFPSTRLPTAVDRNVASPVRGLANLERVDTLHIQMEAGMESLAHHFIPSTSRQNRLVIVHHGHATSFDDDPGMDDVGFGMQRTINNLLLGGYSVLAMYMLGCLPSAYQCEIDHASIVNTPTTSGSGMKFFVEPVAVCLNYLDTQAQADGFPAYSDFSMIGLSGGGWTTTIYAAIDPRITLSVPIAGSLPLPLRSGSSWGDEEQTHAPFYEIAGYTDLYLLGSTGTGRRQVHVLNRYDNNCFGDNPGSFDEAQTGMTYDDAVRGYESNVRGQLRAPMGGSFSLEIDDVAPAHMISWNAIATIILPELERGNRATPAAAADTFVRGSSGTLLHVGSDGTEDTAFPMVGVPAFVRRDSGVHDVFFRDPKNRLMHAFNEACLWKAESLNVLVITDPVAVRSSLARFDVVALTPDYVPHHWRGTTTGMTSVPISAAPRAFGPPVLSVLSHNRLDLTLQDWNRATHHLHDDGSGAWREDPPPVD